MLFGSSKKQEKKNPQSFLYNTIHAVVLFAHYLLLTLELVQPKISCHIHGECAIYPVLYGVMLLSPCGFPAEKPVFDIARFYFNSFLSKRYFLVPFSDFSLSSSQETNITPSPSAAWTIAHLSRRAGTIPWTASAANCRRFSGAVTESPIHPSRFPNCPPTVTTALSVASGTTWKPS